MYFEKLQLILIIIIAYLSYSYSFKLFKKVFNNIVSINMDNQEESIFYSNFEEKHYTLIFCRRKNEVLLGMKKRGFGTGKWNGFGGKVEKNETFEQGAIRELYEESSLKCNKISSVGYLVFRLSNIQKIMKVHVYETWDFDGIETESEEMKPLWYNESNIPYENMWLDDKYWLPLLLANKKFIGSFDYEDEDTLSDYSIKEQ